MAPAARRTKAKTAKPSIPQGQAFLDAFNEGMALHQAGRLEEAVAAFRKATHLNGSHALPFSNLGSLLQTLGRPEEALEALRHAIALDPKLPVAYSNLGSVLNELKRYDESREALETALRLQPAYAEASNNLCTCLLEVGDLAGARAAVERAIALRPEYAEAHSNLGAVLMAMGRTEEAVRASEHALALGPNLAVVHKNLGLALLRIGEFERGWQEYEWRWVADRIAPRDYPRLLWKGEPLAGKTILLYAEQGLGDALQFARFVPVLAAQGARVILEVHPPLVPLMRMLTDVAEVVPLEEPPQHFDTYQALMSVPGVLGVRPWSIPSPTPYLTPDPALVAKWRERLGSEGFKIGVVWEGKGNTPSQRARSTTLDSFAGLAALPGVRMISLQKGADVAAAPFALESLGDDFDSGEGAFLDTAAVMKSLDLVVTVDTSVAHLAGALAVPTWIAVMFAPDWRWEEQGETTPWYPTARLFRQSEPGAWGPAFAAMTQALEKHLSEAAPLLVEGKRAPPPAAPAAPRKRDFSRFDRFLDTIDSDVYPETPAEPHLSIIASTIESLHRDGAIVAGQRVLDIGCGQGQALELFGQLGLKATGITLGTDAQVCRDKGLDVLEMDQNFMDFADETFDVLWCRHVLEHSVAPLFTLSEYRRVTKPGGLIYVEVPAPDTSAHHETGPNHYSVLGSSLWAKLVVRAGLVLERSWAINFTPPCGPDTYWSFVLRRPAE